LPTTKPKPPTEEEILEYIRRKGGEVTNDEMCAEGFGDVGRGHDTISKLRALADEGKLRLEIEHMRDTAPTGGNPFAIRVSTVIRWSLPKEKG
jgi:hypothetical protein